MTASGVISQQEESVKQAIDGIALPPGVKFRGMDFGFDHSGDPALYLVYGVSKRLGFGAARMRLLHQFDREVTDASYQTGIERLVYVRFEDTK
jgi:hypothetical protein